MRPSKLFTNFLPLLSLLTFIPFSNSQTILECPEADLSAYLLQLIDLLYANGLTTFESLLAEISGTDSGYSLLSSIFTSTGTTTILVPTDSAFQLAGVWAPFGSQSPEYLVDLFGLHSLEGHYGFNEIIGDGMIVGKSLMRIDKDVKNGTATGGSGGWQENVVMKKGEKGQVVVKTALGDITSWSGPAHLDGYDLLDNIVILPIDHVIPSPPNISLALTLPTTTRSPNGLPLLAAAIANVSSTGADALAGMTHGGLTFFAPVDDAWTGDAWAQIDDESLRAKLVGNHYTTNYTLFSQEWLANTEKATEITAMTGDKLSISIEGDTSYVSIGDQKAQILRADIALENGVLHIIDTVFLVPGSTSGTPPKVLPGGTKNNNNNVAQPSSSKGANGDLPVPSSAAMTRLEKISTAYWVSLAGMIVWYFVGSL